MGGFLLSPDEKRRRLQFEDCILEPELYAESIGNGRTRTVGMDDGAN